MRCLPIQKKLEIKKSVQNNLALQPGTDALLAHCIRYRKLLGLNSKVKARCQLGIGAFYESTNERVRERKEKLTYERGMRFL